MYQFHEKIILFIFLPACNSIRHPDEANHTLLVGRLIISYNELTEKTNEKKSAKKNNNEKKNRIFLVIQYTQFSWTYFENFCITKILENQTVF